MTELLQLERETTEQRLPMSYEEYLDWCDENVHAEWVAGETIIHMPPRNEHQIVIGFLHSLFSLYAHDLFDLGRAIIAPFEVKLWPDGPSREPDIFFVKRENLHRLAAQRFNGPPDLVVEVISDTSVYRDRDIKFYEYARAGVTEYWIIDPRPGRNRADFFQLIDASRYELTATEDDEWVEARVIDGFRLKPAWLWPNEQPNVLTALNQMSAETAAALRKLLE